MKHIFPCARSVSRGTGHLKTKKADTNCPLHASSHHPWLLCLLLAGAGSYALYRHYMPPVPRPEYRMYPYALLLGCPCRKDGSYSSSQIARCNLAIEAWKCHMYETLIISGAAVKYNIVESEAMARYIHEKCPELPIIEESEARSTWQNLENTQKLVQDAPLLIITGSLHAARASAMARYFFNQYALLSYPDHKPKHILREIGSRAIYLRLEMRKDWNKFRNAIEGKRKVMHFVFKGPLMETDPGKTERSDTPIKNA